MQNIYFENFFYLLYLNLVCVACIYFLRARSVFTFYQRSYWFFYFIFICMNERFVWRRVALWYRRLQCGIWYIVFPGLNHGHLIQIHKNAHLCLRVCECNHLNRFRFLPVDHGIDVCMYYISLMLNIRYLHFELLYYFLLWYNC